MKTPLLIPLAFSFLILTGCLGEKPDPVVLDDTPSPELNNGDSPTPTPVETIKTYDANATLTFDPDTKIASISWIEGSHPDATGYLVQKQVLSNHDSTYTSRAVQATDTTNWVTLKRLGVGGGSYLVQDNVENTAIYRVIGETDGIVRSGSAEATMQIDTQVSARIITSQNGEITSGILNRIIELSLDSDSLAQIKRVDYFIDTKKIATTNDIANAFKYSLNTASYLNGTHRIDAQIFTSGNSAFLVKQTVQTSNSNLNATLSTVGTQGNVYVVVSATSKASINNVKIYLNDQVVFDGNEMNYKNCSRYYYECNDNNAYAFFWDTKQYQPATYQLKTLVKDSAGEEVEKTQSFVLNNPPEFTSLSPQDGNLISDNLRVSGYVSDDQLDLPLVVVKLGDQTLYSDYTNSFSTSYNMAGLPEKEYVISVTATDQSGVVTRKNMTVLYKSGISTQQAIANLPEKTLLLDIKAGKALYRDIQTPGVTKTESHYQNHYLMDINTKSVVQIVSPTAYKFQLGYMLRDDGVLFYSAQITDSDLIDRTHVFMYRDGQYTDLGSKIVDEHTHDTVVSLAGSCTSTYCQYLEPFKDNQIIIGRYNNTYRPGYTLMDLSNFSTKELPRVDKGGLALVGSKYLVHFTSQYISNYYYYHLLVRDYNSSDIFETTGTTSREFALGVDNSRLVYIYWDKATDKNSLYFKNLTDSSAPVKIVDDYLGKIGYSQGIASWVKDNNLYILRPNQTTPEVLIGGATLVQFEAGMLVYQKDGKLHKWDSSNNIHQEIWPQNEQLFIDGQRVFIYRNDQIFEAEG